MTHLTNPTPAQTVRNVASSAALDEMTEGQIESIGLFIQALNAEEDAWHYACDNLELITDRALPALMVWPAEEDKDPRFLGVEFHSDGDCRLFDGDGAGCDAAWKRVAGADVTGFVGAAWRTEFPA